MINFLKSSIKSKSNSFKTQPLKIFSIFKKDEMTIADTDQN